MINIGRALAPHYLAVVGKFAIIGPGIGVLIVLLFEGLDSVPDPGNFLFVVIVFGYALGLIPAALAGMIYTVAWSMRSHLPRLSARQFGTLLGTVAGLVAFPVFTATAMSSGMPDDLQVYLLPAFAGAVCGALVAREREQAHDMTDEYGHSSE
ncbi:hypothetical protein [Massilia sp. YIM B02443]|uniref:hypothetical protein n=1 Tax=Massilia sp. YIM B02443 TaxID=3050127 RepID=UPI0025B65E1C|nr:hypothetical protein [Massilia sp. YIM B02443]MDN4039912.1 hypothetical protein [Massilia sp. YIM B02443]